MQFWKMNGAGNDFIILNNMELKLPQAAFPELARGLCERHLSLGADGLMVVDASDVADFRMLFYNSDGSEGEMCGNGARCISRYGYENGLSGDHPHIETVSGIVIGERCSERLYRIRLNSPTVVERRDLDLDGKTIGCTYVELGCPGLPHAVVPMPGVKEMPLTSLFELGRTIRHHSAFSKGANVNFYDIIGPDHLYLLTWERGVEDFTYACGTGSGAVVTALTLSGAVSGRHVQLDMRGGTLYVDVEHVGERIDNLYLTGPTAIVCKGELSDEALLLPSHY